VTYLTSWSEKEQFEITREVKKNMWARHIGRITKVGFAGIICSAQDIVDITNVNNHLLRVCPGINFKSSNSGQRRTTSPKVAQELGADYAVIGRSVTQTHHPVETIENIKRTLAFRLVSEKL
jgi:orotidine-5'-phosphate decarboxylase